MRLYAPGEYVQLIPVHPETRSCFQAIIINNNCHIICVVNFYIKRSWRFLSDFDVGHCAIFSSQGLLNEDLVSFKINDFIG